MRREQEQLTRLSSYEEDDSEAAEAVIDNDEDVDNTTNDENDFDDEPEFVDEDDDEVRIRDLLSNFD